MAIKHCAFTVAGDVQGVGFRAFTQEVAKRSNIVGFVKNTSKGVEGEAQGEAAALDEFKSALKQESPGSVEKIDYKDEKDLESASYTSFDVKH